MTLEELLKHPQLPAYQEKRLREGGAVEIDGKIFIHIPADEKFGTKAHNVSFRLDFAGNLIIQGHPI